MLVQIAPLADPRITVRFFDRITHRPAVTITFVLATVTVGAHALIGLERGVDPGLGRPAIGITVRYSGALPSDVEREVVRRIERRVSGVRGIVRTEATAQEGVGRVVVYFDYLRQLERASLAVQDSVDAARRELPPGTAAPVVSRMDSPADAMEPAGDRSRRADDSLASIGLTIVEGAALAFLTVLCAARSWRSALIVLFSVAVSTVGTFELMALVGIRLTRVTLLGVVLAMMFILDDGVTVRQSIVRQVELGFDSRKAASAGVSIVIRGLALGGLAAHAMFGFLAMVGGGSGRWFAGIGMVAMGAVGASLLASATLIPSVSALFAPRSSGGRIVASSTRLDLWLERAADRHHDLLAWSIGHRRAVAVAALGAACLVGSGLASVVRTDSTSRTIELEVRGPDAHTLSGVARRLADEVRRVDGVTAPIVSTTVDGDGEALARIDHVDGQRVALVRAAVERRPASEVVQDIDAKVAAIPFPPGYDVRYGGEIADRALTMRRLWRSFGTGLALVAVMLAIRFRSPIPPLSILLGAPVAWFGAFLLLRLTGTPAGVLPLIAGAFLTVLVVRHGVQVLGAYEDRRAHDLNARVSLIEAGRGRLRPTVMSVCALVAALVPLGFIEGTPSGIHRALVIALAGGVVTSAIATLYVLPAVHVLLEDAALVLGARLRARLPRGKRGIRVLPGADDHGVVRS